MMGDTIFLATLCIGLLCFLVYVFLKPGKFSGKKILLIVALFLLAGAAVLPFTSFEKIDRDISRLIRNSTPKSAAEAYAVLFQKPMDNCMTAVHFRDQAIPMVDCCIWMEVNVCPAELARLIKLKNYASSLHPRSDSLNMLSPYKDRPDWWTPQVLGDTILELNIRFNTTNHQSIFFGRDSSHLYLCDQAL